MTPASPNVASGYCVTTLSIGFGDQSSIPVTGYLARYRYNSYDENCVQFATGQRSTENMRVFTDTDPCGVGWMRRWRSPVQRYGACVLPACCAVRSPAGPHRLTCRDPVVGYGSRMRIPKIVGAVGVSLVLALLAACGGATSPPASAGVPPGDVSQTSGDAVLLSLQQSAATKTAAVDVTADVSGIPVLGGQHVTGTGVVDLDAQKAQAHFDALGIGIDAVVDGNTGYVRSTLLEGTRGTGSTPIQRTRKALDYRASGPAWWTPPSCSRPFVPPATR